MSYPILFQKQQTQPFQTRPALNLDVQREVLLPRKKMNFLYLNLGNIILFLYLQDSIVAQFDLAKLKLRKIHPH